MSRKNMINLDELEKQWDDGVENNTLDPGAVFSKAIRYCRALESELALLGEQEEIDTPLKSSSKFDFTMTDKIEQGEKKGSDRPEIVCICGSGRFLKQMHEVEERLTLEGKIVLMIGVNTKDVARTENMDHYKPMLDELHLRKIDLSDKVFVVNVGGYIGESTRKEITYSERHNKPIEYLETETIGKNKPYEVESVEQSVKEEGLSEDDLWENLFVDLNIADFYWNDIFSWIKNKYHLSISRNYLKYRQ